MLSEPAMEPDAGSDTPVRLTLRLLASRMAICKFPPSAPLPSRPPGCEFWSVTVTPQELSVILPEEAAPPQGIVNRGWRCLEVCGCLDFDLVGILASLVAPLATAGVSIFALSTYNTDYLMVREVDLDRSIRVLSDAGHTMHM